MTVKNPSWLAKHLHTKKRVLVMAGALCDEIALDGKKLLDYATDIVKKTGAPVAATGNTVNGFRERGVDTHKSWAAEIANFTKWEWKNPLLKKKPQIIVLIGYSPALATSLVNAIEDAETIVLGSSYIPEATYSLPDARSFGEWERELSDLVQAL